MKKKLCICSIFILIIEYSFCMPGPRIAFYVESFTEQKVVIEYEFINGDSDSEKNYIWKQAINQQLITLFDTSNNRKKQIIGKGDSIKLIEFYPTGALADLVKNFVAIRPIPLMTLLKSTYKELCIYTENKSRVITLDTLESEIVNVKKIDNGKALNYILEIYDKDISLE